MSIPHTYLAAVARQQKPMQVEERPTPQVGDDQLLIQVMASGINPVDWKIRDIPRFSFLVPSWPTILGLDIAGDVVSVGKNVGTSFKVGDKVFVEAKMGHPETYGYQQFAVADAEFVSKFPDSVSYDEAASFPVGTTTAGLALYHTTTSNVPPPWSENGRQVGKGHSIVILGGSSSVGQFTIQFARLSGFEKIVTTSSLTHKAHLEKLGGEAVVVLDRKASQVQDIVKAANGLPLRAIIDSISESTTQNLALQVWKTFWEGQSKRPSFPLNIVITQQPDEEVKKLGQSSKPEISLTHVIGAPYLPPTREVATILVKNLFNWIAEGAIEANRPHVVEGGLRAVDEALRLSKEGVSGVKLVVNPNQTSN